MFLSVLHSPRLFFGLGVADWRQKQRAPIWDEEVNFKSVNCPPLSSHPARLERNYVAPAPGTAPTRQG